MYCVKCRLDESQAGTKIARRNINNLRYVDDTTLMAESELKTFLMKVKEESEKACLKFNIQKTKILASGPITSWQIDEKQWTGSKLGKELVKVVCCHPAYLIYMQSTSWEMPG